MRAARADVLLVHHGPLPPELHGPLRRLRRYFLPGLQPRPITRLPELSLQWQA